MSVKTNASLQGGDAFFKAILSPDGCDNVEVNVDTAYVKIADCTGEYMHNCMSDLIKLATIK